MLKLEDGENISIKEIVAVTQARPRYPTVEAYLDSDEQLDGRYEYCDGELIPLVPESKLNDLIANALLFYLVSKGFFPLALVCAHSCEIQVEKFHQDDKQTRLPDLVLLRPEHIALTQRRLSIRLSIPAPLLGPRHRLYRKWAIRLKALR